MSLRKFCFMTTRGISIVDLLGLPPGSTSLIPADVRTELEKLAVVDFTVIASDAAFIYSGTIRSLGEAFFASSLNWPIELPLLNVGVPFQLVRRRLPLVADIEPAPDGFQLDLLLNRIAIRIPGLQPAKAIEGAGVTPAHLVRPIAGDPLFGKGVKIVGSGTLRIASAPGGGAPVIRFVAPPVSGVQKRAALYEYTVSFRDERRNPAHIELGFARAVTALQAVVEIKPDWFFPMTVVGRVNREFGTLCRNFTCWRR